MTPRHEFEHDVKLDVEARVRQGVKAVFEEVLEEEMTEHLEAGYRVKRYLTMNALEAVGKPNPQHSRH